MKYTKIALGVAALAAMTAAQAADIQMYGRVDAGLLVTDVEGQQTQTELNSGGRSANRLGFNIVEDLGDGYKVKAYLENGFKIDTGEFSTSGSLFDRRAILAVEGPWGEIGGGRAGTVQSTSAPYSMGAIKWDVFGTSYKNASIATTFANSSRVNNSINYLSPVVNNLKFGLSYSTGDKAETDEDGAALEWQEKQHTFAAAVNYIGENLWLGLTFANVDMAHVDGGLTPEDARAYQLGGWYRVNPTVRLFGGVGYQTNWTTAAKLGASKVTSVAEEKAGGWDGYSAVLGAEYKSGPHKVMADVQHFSGELAANSAVEFKRTVYAAGYEYSFAKKVIGYTAVNFSDASGSATKGCTDAAALDTWQAFVGLCWLW